LIILGAMYQFLRILTQFLIFLIFNKEWKSAGNIGYAFWLARN
jgi:hypothetical protein